MTSRGYDPRQSPGLGYKRVVSCEDSFHGTDVLAVSEHGAPGRRPNIHAHFVGRQREDGLDTTAGPRRRGKPKHSHRGHPVPGPWKRRSQAVRERKTSVLRACRVPNPAKRLNVVQRPKPLFEPQRSMTSRSYLLVLDDFGLKPLRAPGPEDLYDVINERYERGSILLTSNRDRAEWPDLFGEPLLASAALDRLTHGAHFVEIAGQSFRAEHTKKQLTARRPRGGN